MKKKDKEMIPIKGKEAVIVNILLIIVIIVFFIPIIFILFFRWIYKIVFALANKERSVNNTAAETV